MNEDMDMNLYLDAFSFDSSLINITLLAILMTSRGLANLHLALLVYTLIFLSLKRIYEL